MSDNPVIDWEDKPEPWRSIGLQFQIECAAIIEGKRLPPVRRISEGGKLRQRRINIGLTQQQVAALAYIAISTLKLVESDHGTKNSLTRVRNAITKAEEDAQMRARQPFA